MTYRIFELSYKYSFLKRVGKVILTVVNKHDEVRFGILIHLGELV